MARLDDRGGRDAAGVGPYKRPDVRLVPLRKLDGWSLTDGEPDIRGWEVRTVGGTKIGNVQDLLVDEGSREVVMLDVDLDGSERHALAPIRAAQIDRATRVVRLDSADIEGGIPSLSRRATTDEEARQFNEGYGKAYGSRGWRGDRDYVVDRDEDEVRFARREAEDDAARAENVASREAARDARAERHAEREARREVASEPGADDATERKVRYHADEGVEETVVERRPVVVEEVVVRRRVVEDRDADQR